MGFCAKEFFAPRFAMVARLGELLDGIGFPRQHDLLGALLSFVRRVEGFPIRLRNTFAWHLEIR